MPCAVWGYSQAALPVRSGPEEWLDYHQYEDIRTLINNRQNNRRRGRGGGPRPNGANPGNDRGNRIDNRARGNAAQLHEKYKTMARDAQMQGDRVMSEYYFQFADHYFRVLSETRSRFEENNRGRPDQGERDDQFDDGEEGDVGDNQSQRYDGPPQRYQERDYNRQQSSRQGGEDERPRQAEARRVDVQEQAPDRRINGHSDPEPEAPVAEPVRRGRGRRPAARRDEPAQDLLSDVERSSPEDARIEMDRLPPSFAAPEAEEPAEKPKRRGRPRRAEAPVADA